MKEAKGDDTAGGRRSGTTGNPDGDKHRAAGGVSEVQVGPSASTPKTSKRLRSLDALRGFDMFWIVGGDMLMRKLAQVNEEQTWLDRVAKEFYHAPWEGFTFYDLIFPLFLFLAGVAIPYSLGGKLDKGASKLSLVRKSLVRLVLLILLGWVYNGGLAFKPLEETRVCSVLGFIGIGWFGAAMIYLFSGIRSQAAWLVGILIGYWTVLMYVPVPGYEAGDLSPEGTIRTWLDRELLPWAFNIQDGSYDSQGILVSAAGVATALLGLLTGQFLRRTKFPAAAKSGLMLAAGLVSLGAAALWSGQMFISKELWNPPFILHCAGYSLLLLGLFHLIIDALGFWRWSYFFIVVGMNAITIYLGTRMVDFWHSSDFLFGGLLSKVEPPQRDVYAILAYIGTWWLVLLFLHRKRIYLRV